MVAFVHPNIYNNVYNVYNSVVYQGSSLHVLTGAQLLLHGPSQLSRLKLQLTSGHICLQRELDTQAERQAGGKTHRSVRD